MDDTQLLRYSRHILLSELGVDAQNRFSESHALIVGIGGLGNPVAQFLAAAGLGTLTLVDADNVDRCAGAKLRRQPIQGPMDRSEFGLSQAANGNDDGSRVIGSSRPEVHCDAEDCKSSCATKTGRSFPG